MYTLRIYFSVPICVYAHKGQNMIAIRYSVYNIIVKKRRRHKITENFHMAKQFHSDVVLTENALAPYNDGNLKLC